MTPLIDHVRLAGGEWAAPIAGPHGQDGTRILFSRMVRRMVYGEHQHDIEQRLATSVNNARLAKWGSPDMGSNPLKSVCGALATLYDAPPVIRHERRRAAIADDLEHVWPSMIRVQRDTLAMREQWVHCDVTGAGIPRIQPIPPDLTCAVPYDDRPDEPHTVYWAKLRKEPGEAPRWMWDEYSVLDPAKPVWRTLKDNGEETYQSFAWPDRWRKKDGTAILPFVLYHAAKTPYLFDPYQWIELVEGTLNLAILRTQVAHVARSSAWRQRWLLDCAPEGATGSSIVTDPATVLMLKRADIEGANPQVGTFEVPVVPQELWSYIEGYVRSLLAEAGIYSSEATRLGGDARSGNALAIDRDTQREVQRRAAPIFAPVDAKMVALFAVILNRVKLTTYPEDGYQVRHKGVPQSAHERAAHRDHVLALVDKGLMTIEEARAELFPDDETGDETDDETDDETNAQAAPQANAPQANAQAPEEEPAAAALNGAQVAALVDLVMQVTAKQIPVPTGIAIAAIAFPAVPVASIQRVFDGLATFTPAVPELEPPQSGQ